jgi:iron-sulfur cluster repair protein YtfE (RIC family)
MNDLLELSTVPECEPEWLERPVSVVATHISRVYHEFTRERLPIIADLAARVQSVRALACGRFVPQLLRLVTELRDAVETHAWTEDDLLFPVLVAHEYPNVLTTSLSAVDLLKLVETLTEEHVTIRKVIGDLEEHTNGFRVTPGTPSELQDLVKLVEELTRSLVEELDLEDRCLLPRARALAGEPTP